MRILGIDPGLAIVGYCILDHDCNKPNNAHKLVDSGSIQTSKKSEKPERLLEIHNDIEHLITKYKPDVAAIEQLFFFKNAKTITSVSEARGVILMTLAKFDITIFEYTPLVIKQTVTGYGRAGKDEVRDMLQVLLSGQTIPKLDDTTDAIAIAICQTMMER